ncbi:MAG: hypothetical protein ACD_8C00082G0001 [uncultured bacterium]|nr:MAG: hypothetical protein ACD_8C00082G0001 [uncultured bacterium]
MKYVVNAAPQIQDVISSQGSDGKVTTTFNVIDLDTSTGRTANTVLGGFQYCTANCTNPGSETWVNATSLTYKDSINNILGNNILTVQELTLTSYTVIWDSKSDYDEQYNGSFKVRILANDSEDANNIGYGISNAFEFDTKDPINLSFTIDHTKSTNNLTLVAPSDDLPYQVAYSNYSDFRDAVFEDYPVDNKKTYPAIIDNDPATVYVRARDVKGNYMDATATTPASPSSVVYYDTSNDVSGEYREFIAWDVISAGQSGAGFGSYEIYRAERLESDQNATLNYLGVESIPDPNTNFYNDFNLDTNKHYYYKILTTDSAGNLSKYSSAVDDNPNGQGGSDQTPPTISNVRSTSINTTSATILWDTDEPANSSVGYSSQVDCDDAPGNLCPYLPERGIAAMVEKYTEGDPSKPGHSITLTGLIPGTTYNIRVKSYDVVGNLGQNDKDNNGASAIENFTFNTLPGPAISGVTIPNVSNTQATINWKTTTDSSSFVVYSTDISNGNLVNPKEFGTPELVGNPTSGEYYHSQTITTYNDLPLVPNETYYFYVKSIDGDGNEAVDNNGGSFYELTTTEDNKKPEIALIEIPVISNEGGVITWTTDEPATSKVSYGTTEGGPYPDHQEVVTFNRGHYIILSGLAADEDYYFKVESMDINGNVNDDTAEYNFKTTKNIEFDHPPLSKIENMDVTAENTRDTNAIITFTTDQPALCYAETDAVIVGSATTVTSFENGYTEDKNYNTSHSILVSSLTPESKYLYDVSCHDNILTVGMEDESDKFDKFENWIYSEIGDFETTKQRFALDELDINSPVINNVKVASTTGESATITWNTDEVGSSSVGYGITATNENGANDQIVNENKEKFATSHLVTLSGLIPSTKYLFRVSSTDKSGNIGFSAESSFTTASPSSLSSIKAESLNLGEAQITWNTSSETSSIVEYGLTTSYGEKKESNTLTKEHSISLSNLNQGVTYHFRVKGQDKDKKLYSSSDQTFEPKSPAQVSNININDITEHEATISFNTNIPTTATVIYTNISDPADNGSQADNEMATKHSIQIKNLTQGATFKIQIQARDEQGTESQTDAKDLTTGKDENPPKIDMVKTDLALAQNDKVQAIISWNTDEQSTTSVLYKEGRNAEAKEINISEALSTNHVAVITSFKPGTVYYFNTKSVDASGNEAKSTDYALLTPRRKENIIQIIIGNFTDIFGWAKF